jgi:DNA-binding NtrC family response regulator
VLSLALSVAKSDAAVLITGPNGSGKEKIAEIIQANSRRRSSALVTVNAGGLPDELLEAELFGAEAGAFTGAKSRRQGRFEAAHGGTLFLDELGNLSTKGQMKLLRVLQTGEFERLGSNSTQKVDVRILSATNANLKRAIANGTFREDLYFRLAVIEIHVPALRRRPDDIVPLAQYFARQFSGGADARGLSAASLDALLDHDWPGNVRELQNRVRRGCLVGQGPLIEPQDMDLAGDTDGLAESVWPPAGGVHPAPDDASHGHEQKEIDEALQRARGVISRAAADLGLSRQALYRRMARLGIAVERRTTARL